jgi:hypothetical protein
MLMSSHNYYFCFCFCFWRIIGVRLPGDIDYHGTSFSDIPSGLGALTAVPAAGWLQMFFFVGVLEIAVMKDITGDGEWVGDFRNDFIDFVSIETAGKVRLPYL